MAAGIYGVIIGANGDGHLTRKDLHGGGGGRLGR